MQQRSLQSLVREEPGSLGMEAAVQGSDGCAELLLDVLPSQGPGHAWSLQILLSLCKTRQPGPAGLAKCQHRALFHPVHILFPVPIGKLL